MLCGSEPAPLVRSLSDIQQDWACARLDSLLPETKPSTRGAAPKTQFSHISALLYWAAAPLCSMAYNVTRWSQRHQETNLTNKFLPKLYGFHFWSFQPKTSIFTQGIFFSFAQKSTVQCQCMEGTGRKEPLKFILKHCSKWTLLMWWHRTPPKPRPLIISEYSKHTHVLVACVWGGFHSIS